VSKTSRSNVINQELASISKASANPLETGPRPSPGAAMWQIVPLNIILQLQGAEVAGANLIID